jgi:hypothetical protein
VQNLLEHSSNSFTANSDLSAGAQVPRYGWKQSHVANQEPSSRKKNDGKASNDVSGSLDKDEIGRILDDFRKANPPIKVATKDNNQDLMVCLRP